MDNSVVVFEHVHFFNFSKGLHSELLDSSLDFLVFASGSSGGGLARSGFTMSSLSTYHSRTNQDLKGVRRLQNWGVAILTPNLLTFSSELAVVFSEFCGKFGTRVSNLLIHLILIL